MNRNTRTLIVLIVAILTAAGATAAMYFLVGGNRNRQAEAPKVYVAVAKKYLPLGAVVAEADVKMVAWPKDSLISGATTLDQVRNHALISDVLENEPITESKLAKEGVVGLATQIAPNFRAISVKVNEVIGVAGFVTPGTYVDVVVTIREDRDAKSRVVVQNVKVLTAGTKYDDPDARKQGKPIPSTVVTLMVTPEQAERIAVAQTEGQIVLALRNPLDAKDVITKGITSTELMAGGVVPTPTPTPTPKPTPVKTGGTGPKPQPPPPPPPERKCEVETFKAGKKEVLPCS